MTKSKPKTPESRTNPWLCLGDISNCNIVQRSYWWLNAKRRNSGALAIGLRLFHINPSMSEHTRSTWSPPSIFTFMEYEIVPNKKDSIVDCVFFGVTDQWYWLATRILHNSESWTTLVHSSLRCLSATFHKQNQYQSQNMSMKILVMAKTIRQIWRIWYSCDDLEIQYGTSSVLRQALCIISKPSVNSNWSYTPETPKFGSKSMLLCPVWP